MNGKLHLKKFIEMRPLPTPFIALKATLAKKSMLKIKESTYWLELRDFGRNA
jgi:hypothetical protein